MLCTGAVTAKASGLGAGSRVAVGGGGVSVASRGPVNSVTVISMGKVRIVGGAVGRAVTRLSVGSLRRNVCLFGDGRSYVGFVGGWGDERHGPGCGMAYP